MTSFKIINDDVGVRGLQEANKKPAISGPVLPVTATKPVQKSPENLPLNVVHTVRTGNEAHHAQRRKLDRRKTATHVLLETRSLHERRIKSKIIDNTEAKNELDTSHGIDEIV